MKNELAYPHLFSPIQIGDVIFKNRIWSAPAGESTQTVSAEHVVIATGSHVPGSINKNRDCEVCAGGSIMDAGNLQGTWSEPNETAANLR